MTSCQGRFPRGWACVFLFPRSWGSPTTSPVWPPASPSPCLEPPSPLSTDPHTWPPPPPKPTPTPGPTPTPTPIPTRTSRPGCPRCWVPQPPASTRCPVKCCTREWPPCTPWWEGRSHLTRRKPTCSVPWATCSQPWAEPHCPRCR